MWEKEGLSYAGWWRWKAREPETRGRYRPARVAGELAFATDASASCRTGQKGVRTEGDVRMKRSVLIPHARPGRVRGKAGGPSPSVLEPAGRAMTVCPCKHFDLIRPGPLLSVQLELGRMVWDEKEFQRVITAGPPFLVSL